MRKVMALVMSLLFVFSASLSAYANEEDYNDGTKNEVAFEQPDEENVQTIELDVVEVEEAEDYAAAVSMEVEDEKPVSLVESFRNSVEEDVELESDEEPDYSEERVEGLLSPAGEIDTFAAEIAPRNVGPNTAIFLPPEFYGFELYDLASGDERWYSFELTETSKVHWIFVQSTDGDYDLALYKQNGTALNLVGASQLSGTQEQISVTADAGTYYMRVIPYIPAATPYSFIMALYVSGSGDFDSHEPNDTPAEAAIFSNTMDTSGNIDNPYDEDWYRLNVTTAATKDINVTDAPAGDQYAMFIYDSNLNSLGSFYIGDETLRSIDLPVGQYYFRVRSMTGYNSPDEYSIEVKNYIPPEPGLLYTMSFSEIEVPAWPEDPEEPILWRRYVTSLRIEPGQKVVMEYESESLSPFSNNRDSLGVRLDFRGTAFGVTDVLWSAEFKPPQGFNRVTTNYPYKFDSIVGRPLYPTSQLELLFVLSPDAGLGYPMRVFNGKVKVYERPDNLV